MWFSSCVYLSCSIRRTEVWEEGGLQQIQVNQELQRWTVQQIPAHRLLTLWIISPSSFKTHTTEPFLCETGMIYYGLLDKKSQTKCVFRA